MADGQPSALRTSCHTGSETSVVLPGEQELYVCSVATCDLNHILTSCEHFAERAKMHWENGGTICAVTECRHDMMINIYIYISMYFVVENNETARRF